MWVKMTKTTTKKKRKKNEEKKKEPWTVYILKMQADQSSTILNHCKLDRSQTYALIFFILPRFIAFLSTRQLQKNVLHWRHPHPPPAAKNRSTISRLLFWHWSMAQIWVAIKIQPKKKWKYVHGYCWHKWWMFLFFLFFKFLKHAHVQTHMYACMHRGTLTHTHTHHRLS